MGLRDSIAIIAVIMIAVIISHPLAQFLRSKAVPIV